MLTDSLVTLAPKLKHRDSLKSYKINKEIYRQVNIPIFLKKKMKDELTLKTERTEQNWVIIILPDLLGNLKPISSCCKNSSPTPTKLLKIGKRTYLVINCFLSGLMLTPSAPVTEK